ncbi:MAG: PKD domain-containing protein [Chitinophagales bacterium]
MDTDLVADWYDASISGTLLLADNTSFTPTTEGFYYAEARDAITGCVSSVRTEIEVVSLALPTVSFSGFNTSLQHCENDAVIVLTGAPLNGTFTTTTAIGLTDNTGGTATFDPTLSGTGIFDVTYTFTDGSGCMNSEIQTITIFAPPTLNFTSSTCSLDLTSYDVVIESNATMVTADAGTVTDNLDGTFTIADIPSGTDVSIDATDSNCSNNLDVSAPDCSCPTIDAPISTAGSSVSYCEDATIPTLTVTVDTDLVADWYDASISGTLLLADNTSFTPTTEGFYYAEARDAITGCVSSVRTEIEVVSLALPTVSFSGFNTSLQHCENDAVIVLTGAPLNGTFTTTTAIGLTDNTGGTATFDPTLSGTGIFDVTYTFTDGSGCMNSEIQTITIFAPPTLNFTSSTCSLDLTSYDVVVASNATMVTADAGTVTDNLDGTFTIADIPSGTDVSIDATDSNCSNNLDVSAPDCSCPTIDAPISTAGSSVSYCEDATIPTLTVTVDTDLVADWYDASTGGTLLLADNTSFTPTIEGFYYAEARDATTGCISSVRTEIEVVSLALPTVSFSGFNTSLQYCENDAVIALTGAPLNGTFTTTTAIGLTDNTDGTATFDPALSGTGTFDVTYTFTDGSGCTNSETQTVSVFAAPTLSFISSTCASDLLTYDVIVESNADIVTSNEGTVTDNLNGTFTIAGIPNGTNINVNADNGNCSNSIDVVAPDCSCPTVDAPISTAGSLVSYCVDDVIPTLTVTVGDGFVADWYDASAGGTLLLANNTSFTPTSTGIFYAETRDPITGCVSLNRTAIEVIEFSLPNVSFSGFNADFEYCVDDANIVLTGSPLNGTFTSTSSVALTDNTDGTATFSPSLSGIGTFDVTYFFNDANNCSSSQTQTITVFALPTLNFVSSTCSADLLFYEVIVESNANLISTNEGTVTDNLDGTFRIEGIPSGTDLSIEASDDNCVNSLNLTAPNCNCPDIDAPISSVGGILSYCEDVAIPTLTVTVQNGFVADWYDTSTSGTLLLANNVSFTPSNTGIFYAEAKDPDTGCTSLVRTGIEVNSLALPTVNFSGFNATLQYCENDGLIDLIGAPLNGTFSSASTALIDNTDGTATFDPTISGTGTFSVTYTFVDANFCSNSQTQTITVFDVPTLNFVSSTCSGDLTFYDVIVESNASTVTADNGTVTDNLDGTFTIAGVSSGTDLIVEVVNVNGNCINILDITAPNCSCPFIAEPVSLVGGSVSYCENDIIPTLTATIEDGFVVDWYDAPINGNLLLANNTNFTPSNAGTFYAETRDPITGCTSLVRTPIEVIQFALPSVSFTGFNIDLEYCVNDEAILLTGSPSNGIFTSGATTGLTDNGDGTATFSPSTAEVGIFDVTYTFTDGNFCSNSQTQTVTVFPIPTLNFISTTCSGDLLFYDVVVESNAATLSTNEGMVTDNLDGTFTIAGIPSGTDVNIEAEDINALCFNNLEVTAPNCNCPFIAEPASLVGSSVSYCQGDAIPVLTVTVEDGFVVDWYDAPNNGNLLLSDNVNFTPTNSGTFYAETRDPNTGCTSSVRTAIEVLQIALPNVSFSGFNEDFEYCLSDEAILLTGLPANGTFSSTSSTALTDNENGTATFSPSMAGVGTFEVTYSAVNGSDCSDSQTQTISIFSNPTLNFISTTCSDDLSSYDAVVESNAATIATNEGIVTNNFDGTFTIAGIPSGVGLIMDASDLNGLCTNGLGIAAPDCDCPTIAPPLSQVGSSVSYCEGDGIPTLTVTITIEEGFVVDWYDAPTDGTLLLADNTSFTPNNTGIFYAETRNVDTGCKSSIRTPIEVITNSLPNVSFTGFNTNLQYCINNEAIVLTGSPLNGTFSSTAAMGLIDNEDGTATFDPSLSGVGGFDVTYTFMDANNCSNSQTQTITVFAVPTLNFVSANCSVDLSSYDVVIESNAATLTSNEGIVTDNLDGTFTIAEIPSGVDLAIEVTNVNGNCSNNLDLTAPDCDCAFLAPPSSEGDASICVAEVIPPLTVLVGENQTADWYDAPVNGNLLLMGSLVYTPTVEGTFYAEARFVPDGCTSLLRTAVSLEINPLPTVSITGLGDAYCDDAEVITFNGSQTGGLFSSNIPEGLIDNGDGTASLDVAAIGAGNFEVFYTFTDQNECSNLMVQEVTINETPILQVVSEGSLCDGTESLSLNETGGNATSWSWTGPNNFQSDAQNPLLEGGTLLEGTYTVEAFNDTGCSSIASIDLALAAGSVLPSNLLIPSQACVGDTVHFIEITETEITPTTYVWDFGDGTGSTERDPAHIFGEAGEYNISVEVFDNECGSLSIQKEISVTNCRRSLLPPNELMYFNAYPNPSTDGTFVLDLELAEMDDVFLQLYDEQGRIVETRVLRDVEFQKEVFQLEHSGMYFLQFQTIRLNLREGLKILVER